MLTSAVPLAQTAAAADYISKRFQQLHRAEEREVCNRPAPMIFDVKEPALCHKNSAFI